MIEKSNIRRLLEVSSQQITSGEFIAADEINLLQKFGRAGERLLMMLQEKNGFYAFESALHIFPCGGISMDIFTWNKSNLWKQKYAGDIIESLCFAEDIFGGQFCIQNETVVYFESETGEFEVVAKTIEDWAALICQDYEIRIGYPLAHIWQKKYGALAIGKRLIAKLPFVLGGEYHINNLVAIEAVRGMILRANLAEQIKSQPDGSKISFEVIE